MSGDSLQSCTIRRLYGGLLALAAVYAFAALDLRASHPLEMAAWLVLMPLGLWVHSRLRSLLALRQDQRPERVAAAAGVVKLYTLLGCPYCLPVERRLKGLEATMGFSLRHIDLTLQPKLAVELGIRSVPTIEVGGERLTGNATSVQLSQLIGGALCRR